VTVTLPDKPSELIRLAVEDFTKCEAACDKFEIDMAEYCHTVDGKCHVCLAGAVMAQTLGCNGTFEGRGEVWRDKDLNRKMEFLNCIRLGFIGHALEHIGGYDTKKYEHLDRDVIGYWGPHKETFKRQVLKIADDLEAVGL